MNDEQYIELIENLNLENKRLSSSKEYKLGNLFYEAKKKKIPYIVKTLRKKKAGLEIKKKYIQVNNEENRTIEELIRDRKRVNGDYKIAVYTCITGNYDEVVEPSFISENIDYIMFSNKEKNSENWKILDIPKYIKELNNDILINRYIKMHPHELLYMYDYTVYIDGNVKVISDITPWIKYANNQNGFALHRHYQRTCIFEEAEVAKLYRKGNLKKLDEQVGKYKTENFPKNYGLLEATIIVSKIDNEKCKDIMNQWWKEFLHSGSMRDQLSLPYILWKNNIAIEKVSLLGRNLYNSVKVKVAPH